MTRMDALPPDDTTPEGRAWEEWVETVKVGDKVKAAGMPGTVTNVNHTCLWVILDGQGQNEPIEWYDVGPIEVTK